MTVSLTSLVGSWWTPALWPKAAQPQCWHHSVPIHQWLMLLLLRCYAVGFIHSNNTKLLQWLHTSHPSFCSFAFPCPTTVVIHLPHHWPPRPCACWPTCTGSCSAVSSLYSTVDSTVWSLRVRSGHPRRKYHASDCPNVNTRLTKRQRQI